MVLLSLAWLMSDQVVEHIIIPERQKLTVWTSGAFNPGLSANTRHPIILARRLVSAATCTFALKPKGVDIVATTEERPE
jgi:hypothetical protein